MTTTTAKPHRDLALDGLRGLAVLMVYVFHYGGGLQSPHRIGRLFGYLTSAGWIGVTLFFALSGFLITGILQNSIGQPHRLRNFYARRILRILPLYYGVLLLVAIVMVATGHTFRETRDLTIYVLFLQNLPHFGPIAREIPALPLYHLWSLAVEEQFYLLWPFLLLLCRSPRAALRLCLASCAASIVFTTIVFGLRHLISGETASSLSVFTLTHSAALSLGAAIAIALSFSSESKEHRFIHRFARPACILGVAIYVASSLYLHNFTLGPRFQYIFGLPAVALACAATIPLALRPGWVRSLCSTAPLRFLGRIGYGFYVFHILLMPVFDAIGRHVTHTSFGSFYQVVRLIAAFPITLAVSWIVYHLWEVPFLRLKRFFPMQYIPSHTLPSE